jgi:hypothetical protein
VTQENSGQHCLFGWPDMPWKGRRGKPPHLVTEENVNKIKLLLALGWANKRIAAALAISEPTLRKHYLSVLKVRALARDALDARRAELLWAQVEKGNVGAMKQFTLLLEANDRMRWANAQRRGDDDDDQEIDDAPAKAKSEPARRTYLGKKDAALIAAEDAIGSDPDLQPSLLN